MNYLVRLAVEPGDEAWVASLFLAMLQHLAQWGHDLAPTRENADRFTRAVLAPAAHKGEPVLLAFDGSYDSDPVAAIFWVRSPDDPATAIGYGTYVRPEHQRRGLGKWLRHVAIQRLILMGVKTVYGSALAGNEAGHASLLALGMKPKSTVYQLDLAGAADLQISKFRRG